MIILMLYNLAIICLVSFYVVFSIFLILQFNRRSTIHFKLLERFVCCLLNSLEHIVVSQCAACGLVLCVCVCQHHVVVSRGNNKAVFVCCLLKGLEHIVVSQCAACGHELYCVCESAS